MRRTKALLPHPDGSGRTLIRAAAETLLAAGLSPVVVVLGHARREIAPELRDLGNAVRAVSNPAYQRGMLSSLQVGIRVAGRRAAYLLGGGRPAGPALPFPWPHPEAGRRRGRAQASPPPRQFRQLRPCSRTGTWGLPVVLRRRLFPEVLELSGTRAIEDRGRDRGAGRVLARHRQDLVVVPAEDRDLLDLDTWESYTKARHSARAEQA